MNVFTHSGICCVSYILHSPRNLLCLSIFLIISSLTKEFFMSLYNICPFSLFTFTYFPRWNFFYLWSWGGTCVDCVMYVWIHDSVYTCHNIHPSLMHCFLVMMHRARKVSMFMAAVASMIANSEYDKQ